MPQFTTTRRVKHSATDMFDLVANVESLPAPGETVLALGYGEHPGGKGLNQAVAAARFGPDLAAYLQQPPPVYVGLNGKLHQYAYAQTDLGVVAWQGETIFAEPGVTPDRTERMLWARQTLPARGGELHFAVHPDFAASLGGKATLRVVYLDRGTDQWSVRYDSPTGVRTAGTVTKTNSNRWREVRWFVRDARLQQADRTQGDVILSDHGDGADIFHLVEVLRA